MRERAAGVNIVWLQAGLNRFVAGRRESVLLPFCDIIGDWILAIGAHVPRRTLVCDSCRRAETFRREEVCRERGPKYGAAWESGWDFPEVLGGTPITTCPTCSTAEQFLRKPSGFRERGTRRRRVEDGACGE